MMGFGLGSGSAIYMFVFWFVTIALAVWLLSRLFPRESDDRSYRSPTGPADRAETALEILRQRYARGEISQGEYEQIRHDLDA